MSGERRILAAFRKRDWLISFGIVLTVAWIGGGLWYLAAASRSMPVLATSPDVIGSFLEGAFAPLAFLWLVIGLFVQQRELARHAEALRKTSEQTEMQTQAIAATEMNARQETFFKIRDAVSHQLGGITGLLYASSMGPIGSGRMSREEMDEVFRHAASGDHEVFARRFLTSGFLDDENMRDLFFGTDIRRRHTANFVRTFERLCALARNCDVDGIIEDSLKQNAFGLLHRRIREWGAGSGNELPPAG